MQTIILTKELIEQCESRGRAYTYESIRILAGSSAFDSSGNPLSGWKDRAIGRQISEVDFELAKAALTAKDVRRIEKANRLSTGTLF